MATLCQRLRSPECPLAHSSHYSRRCIFGCFAPEWIDGRYAKRTDHLQRTCGLVCVVIHSVQSAFVASNRAADFDFRPAAMDSVAISCEWTACGKYFHSRHGGKSRRSRLASDYASLCLE